jgi:hypothetical protein
MKKVKKLTFNELKKAGIVGGMSGVKTANSGKGEEAKGNGVETQREWTSNSEVDIVGSNSLKADPRPVGNIREIKGANSF